MRLYNWMSGLNDERKLVELCLPGSHDAGVYRDLDAHVTPGPRARCQYSRIFAQAMAGARVFDVRVFLRTIRKRQTTPTMGHFFKEYKDGYVGEYGGTLMSALEDAADFLRISPSEFLIFRIGHTKCTGSVNDALKQFRETTIKPEWEEARYPKALKAPPVPVLPPRGTAAAPSNSFPWRPPGGTDAPEKDWEVRHPSGRKPYADVVFRGTDCNLASLQVKRLRGHLLLVYDKEFGNNLDSDEGYYPYLKYPDIPNVGLSFCGRYSGGLPKAVKIKGQDKGNWSADGAVRLANGAWEAHTEHGPDHLLWVYWQQTGGEVEQKVGDMHGRLDEFLDHIKAWNSKVDDTKKKLPNVIGHDFVDETTCSKIVRMNWDLGGRENMYLSEEKAFTQYALGAAKTVHRTRLVRVPDVKGCNAREATDLLKPLGLDLGYRNKFDQNALIAIRIGWQDPGPGTEVVPGTSVIVSTFKPDSFL